MPAENLKICVLSLQVAGAKEQVVGEALPLDLGYGRFLAGPALGSFWTAGSACLPSESRFAETTRRITEVFRSQVGP